jgi:cell division protein FtsB
MFRVSSSLTADSLAEIEELERPFAVVSLTAQADQTLRTEVNRLTDENEDLKKELSKLQNRATRRKRKRAGRK